MEDKKLDDKAREAWEAIDEKDRETLRGLGVLPSHERNDKTVEQVVEEAVTRYRRAQQP